MQAFAQATESIVTSKHHFVPQSLYNKLPLRPETQKVFEEATTAPLRAERHGWSKEHAIYNDAVREHFARFLDENNVELQQMTPDQARKFVDEVKRSNDPRIRKFNLKIYMREIIYWIRRAPRSND